MKLSSSLVWTLLGDFLYMTQLKLSNRPPLLFKEPGKVFGMLKNELPQPLCPPQPARDRVLWADSFAGRFRFLLAPPTSSHL